MKLTDSNSSTALQSASSRPLVLGAVSFVLGAALAGAWFQHQKHQFGSFNDELSAQTRNSLAHLEAPVNIRFYTLLPAAGTSEELQSFSGRVQHLLDAMQAASDGKVQVTRFELPADTNAAAASADGIQAFNLDKGDATFLGLAMSSDGHKEAIPRLSPEWEPALQFDLVRALVRVSSAPAPAPVAREIAQPSPEIVNSIKRLIPDVSTVSAQDADQIFHAEFLKECALVGTEMESQMNAAQKQVEQAQNSGSADDLATAQKNLLEVQLQQGEKMKQIAADLQTRLAVFQQIKAGATNAAP